MSKTKMTKDTVPENFTMTLALTDALPVLFFGGSMTAAGILFKSVPFLIGAFLCLFAGAAKVIWKIIVVLRKKSIWWLFLQMRILMPAGFAVMIISLIAKRTQIDFSYLAQKALAFPPVMFFAAGVIGMIMMMIFAFKLDSSDAKSNMIEQLTNGIAQGCFFIGLLLMI